MVRVTVTGRHMAIGESLKAFCLEKVERLPRYYDRITAIDLIIDAHDGLHSAEIIVHADGTHPFVASEDREDAHAAIDVVMDKIERQIHRHKEKLRNRKHPNGGTH